jgi:integrase
LTERAGPYFLLPQADHQAESLQPDEPAHGVFRTAVGWCGSSTASTPRRVSEALELGWSNVDERAQVIRIEDTKNDQARPLPFGALPALVSLIKHRRKVTDATQKKRGMVVSHVFHRNGEPIRYFRRSWITACRGDAATSVGLLLNLHSVRLWETA